MNEYQRVRREFAASILMAEYIKLGGQNNLKDFCRLFLLTLRELRLSHRCCGRCKSSGIEHFVAGSVVSDVSRGSPAFIVKVKKKSLAFFSDSLNLNV
jgi:hypothetical protein